jgi:serine phosphatase RsbU (regulator of sigma subunit)
MTLFFITMSFVYLYFSSKEISSLAEYACKIDQKNNSALSADLFYNNAVDIEQFWSKNFEVTANAVKMLAENVQEQITANDEIKIFNKNVKLEEYKDRNFYIDKSQNLFNIIYWNESKNIPLRVTQSLNSLKSIGNVFIGIKNLNPKFYYDVYVISTKGYTFGYPRLTSYFENIQDNTIYKKYYPFDDFPSTIRDKEAKVLLPCIFQRPYRDFSGKLILPVKAGIYENGKFKAYVGIDLDFAIIRKKMLNNQIYLKSKIQDSNHAKSFSFILVEDGSIITFPKEFADLFSIPKEYLGLEQFLKRNTIKLSSSRNPLIKNLSKKMKSNDSGVEEIIIEGNVYMIAYTRIDRTGWIFGHVVKKENLLSSTVATKELIYSNVKKIFNKYLFITMFFILFSFLILLILFRHYFLQPIETIRKAIKKMGQGNFEINLKEEGPAEIADLSIAFNYLGKELRNYMRNLKKEVETRQAMETEIEIAAKIQKSILPTASLFSTEDKFSLTAKLNAATNVSGDFYDFFYINKEKIAIVIADVSGKGLQAAFFMAMSKVLIKHCCQLEITDPAKVLATVNKALCMDNEAQMFVTVSLVFYNINDGTFTAARAGHHSGIIFNKKESRKSKKQKTIALGILEDAEYKSGKGKFEIGEIGLQYTDGVVEAVCHENKEYGENKLDDFLMKNKSLPLNDICNKLLNDVISYEDGERFDDITIVAIKRLK